MATSLFGSDGSADNDPLDSIMPPTWAIWLGRLVLIMLPVTLFVPYKWWAALAVLSALIAASSLPRSPNEQ
jgi:hypothetical protein